MKGHLAKEGCRKIQDLCFDQWIVVTGGRGGGGGGGGIMTMATTRV